MGKIETTFKLLRQRDIAQLIKKTKEHCIAIKNKHVVPPLPRTLMIEPTNVCNVRCPTCPTGAGLMNRSPRQMTLFEYKKIIDQSKEHIKEIVLWGYGEPFINNKILEMIKYSVDNGLQVITSTNGQFFQSQNFSNQIVQTGLQRLIVCIDGADQITLEKFRVNASYKNIINGVSMINNAKKLIGTETPKIEMQFLIMKHNQHQCKDMKKLAKELEVDIFIEKEVGLDANASDFQEKCKELLPADLSLSRYYRKKNGSFALKGKFKNYCSFVFNETVINSDGTVIPCCYDLYSKYIMGNAFEEPLETIWKNERYEAFRTRICQSRASIEICNICSEGRRVSKRNKVH